MEDFGEEATVVIGFLKLYCIIKGTHSKIHFCRKVVFFELALSWIF